MSRKKSFSQSKSRFKKKDKSSRKKDENIALRNQIISRVDVGMQYQNPEEVSDRVINIISERVDTPEPNFLMRRELSEIKENINNNMRELIKKINSLEELILILEEQQNVGVDITRIEFQELPEYKDIQKRIENATQLHYQLSQLDEIINQRLMKIQELQNEINEILNELTYDKDEYKEYLKIFKSKNKQDAIDIFNIFRFRLKRILEKNVESKLLEGKDIIYQDFDITPVLDEIRSHPKFKPKVKRGETLSQAKQRVIHEVHMKINDRLNLLKNAIPRFIETF